MLPAIVIIAALVNLQCAATTMYKVDCYAQNILITAALVNVQCARLPEAIYSTCTPDDGWDCHPKDVEEKHLRRIKRNFASHWNYFHYCNTQSSAPEDG